MPGTLNNDSKAARMAAAMLWTVFALGLLLQLFSSHLRIANNTFVMSLAETGRGAQVDPYKIVTRERRLQALSGLCVLGGTIGLAIYYRRTLQVSFGLSKH